MRVIIIFKDRKSEIHHRNKDYGHSPLFFFLSAYLFMIIICMNIGYIHIPRLVIGVLVLLTSSLTYTTILCKYVHMLKEIDLHVCAFYFRIQPSHSNVFSDLFCMSIR